MGAQSIDEQQPPVVPPTTSLLIDETEAESPSTLTTVTAISVNPELLRAKGQATLFVFFQSALLICFLPITYWIFAILLAFLGFYAVKSGKLGWNYLYFAFSCILYFALSLLCAAITFEAAYYLDTLYAVSSFLLSLAFIIIYAMNLKNYTRHIKLLKQGAYQPLATIELVSEEPESNDVNNNNSNTANFYPAQQFNMQSAKPTAAAPQPQPMPMMIPINMPYGQMPSTNGLPQQQQQQQPYYFPVQYYYAVPNTNFGGVDKQ
ncbi:hypothetical protein PPL_09715 [Heterostelium album PN500]|uniref:Uncharacterized protein n=1 Tax=Heterostelium pallidum (strain ATCC 26659 / Pp 5 / PN500) TaxID=670386 RepID=D3BNL2_HETP5|nr:hypothetical protein PPL_09715 [Heterostelium album PN500]EFA76963.1 hypothetical protein PPL_09715 [Heterostelium album PN500]|eukprot:XP_020429094.1 hypothetical protein PPL_09715 [Heterostelium album PN500]